MFGKSSFVTKQSSSEYTREITESSLCLNNRWKELHRGSQQEEPVQLAHNLPRCLKTWGWDRWGRPSRSCREWEHSDRSPAAAEPGKGSSSVPAPRRTGIRNSVTITRLHHFCGFPTFYPGPVLCSHWQPALFNWLISAKTMRKTIFLIVGLIYTSSTEEASLWSSDILSLHPANPSSHEHTRNDLPKAMRQNKINRKIPRHTKLNCVPAVTRFPCAPSSPQRLHLVFSQCRNYLAMKNHGPR